MFFPLLSSLANFGLRVGFAGVAGIAGIAIATPVVADPVIDLRYSLYQGTALSSGVSQFLGMRYAAPPLGDLRWRTPIDPLKTSGIQSAKAFQPICLGISSIPSLFEAEDCLFISVFSPTDATPACKLPVWFFIQGGGYNGNTNYNLNGSTVVAKSNQSLVFVELNYRVGAWGFLASEKIRKEGNLNVGLLDQRQALKWVKKHIAQFGGDPEHVVIHGESAGAGSVALHLISYGGVEEGLFVGAIGESTFWPTQPKVPELEWQFQSFVNETNCNGTANEVECLRSLSTATLQAANAPSPYPGQAGDPLFYWTPCIDGSFLEDYLYSLYEQGKIIGVPIIFGDVTNEGSVFAANAATPSDVAVFFQDNYPNLTCANTAAINTQYPLMAPLPDHAAYFPSASAAYGEATFTCPGLFVSQTYIKSYSPSKVWNYRYNVNETDNIASGAGVYHTFELPAIFGLGNANDNLDSSYATYNKEIIPVVMDFWISFIRNLNPNTQKLGGVVEWESFGMGNGTRILFQTNDTVMESVPADQVERCAFWKGLAGTMEQ